MPMRLRKLLGSLILVVGLILYVLLCMRLAVAVLPEWWPVQLGFYILAGILWAFPAKRLLVWMERPD